MAKTPSAANHPEARAVGRPTDYRPEFCDMVMNAVPIRSAGATDSAIAEHLGVSRMTVDRWKDLHPDFKAACDESKRIADDRVKQSLFARATGYDNPNAVKIFMPQGAAAPVYAPFTEHYPPDVGAAFNWLKNRQPHEWRDRVEHTGADGGPQQVTVTHELGFDTARRLAFLLRSGMELPKVVEHSSSPGVNARPGATSGDQGAIGEKRSDEE
jgi:hypothetical protein